MKNVERDLLNTLQSKSDSEIYTAIIDIINGKYIFEIDYINKQSPQKILSYLEKIIIVGSGIKFKKAYEFPLEAVFKFCDNYKYITLKDIRKDKQLNIKYFLEANKIGDKFEKETAVKAGSVLLAFFIFFSLMGKMKDFKMPVGQEQEIISEMPKDKKEAADTIKITREEPSTAIETTTETTTVETFVTEVSTTEIITEKQTQPENLYTEKEIDAALQNSDKISYVLSEYNLTLEQFDILCAIAMAEAKENSYEDAYAVINTIYNRTISKKWNSFCAQYYGTACARNLYYQAITPGQFVVYENGRYAKFLGKRNGSAYNAIMDFLCTKQIKHNYLSFKSSDTEVRGSVQFVSGGNNYHSILTESDRISKTQER